MAGKSSGLHRKDEDMSVAEERKKLPFASDYMKGAHPAIMERLVETNMVLTLSRKLQGTRSGWPVRLRGQGWNF